MKNRPFPSDSDEGSGRETGREKRGGRAVLVAAAVAVILLAWIVPLKFAVDAWRESKRKADTPAVPIMDESQYLMVVESDASKRAPEVIVLGPEESEVAPAVVSENTVDLPAEPPAETPDPDPADSPPPTELAQAIPPSSIESWKPGTPEDEQRLRAAMNALRDDQDRIEAKSNDMKVRIQKRMVESKGREFLENSDGAKAGQIRTLDVSGYPEDVARKVLLRYGITFESRNVRPDPTSRAFLNAARTQAGEFKDAQREGYYEVFVLSNKAVSMMASMETEALQKRGFQPRTARIRRVVFGIVPDSDYGYALAVTDVEIERVR